MFITFGTGAIVQITTTAWPLRRLTAFGVGLTLVGLAIVVTAAWVSPPSLVLFLLGGALVGGGGGGLFRGALSTVAATATSNNRAGVLATFFVAGYLGLSVPVIGLGIALQYIGPQLTLLAFGLIIGIGILAATPVLLRTHQGPAPVAYSEAHVVDGGT